MSVSIVATPTIGSNTFYRNKDFDISFSVANSVFAFDTSLYFSNSEYGPLSYVSNGHFKSPTPTTGIPTLGSLGTLSVDVLSSNPRFVTTVTPQSYLGTVGVCSDPSGNVYFAHANGNRIYRIDPSGSITTFAGTGTAGDANGDRLTTAQFRGPGFVITDGSGTFYVTDSYRVRKIDPSGTVSTIAGSFANRGYVDSSGASAKFWTPGGMALSPNGSLMVTDNDYHTVRNVTLPDGVVTTYAGSPGFAAFADGTTSVGVPGSFIATSVSGDVLTQSGSSWSITTSPGTVRLTATDTSGSVRLYAGLSNATYGSPIVYQTGPTGALAGATGLGNVTRVNRIASSGPRLVATGTSNTGDRALYTSTNPSTWSVVSTGVLNNGFSVAHAGGTWLAVGVPGLGNSGSNVARSTNGTTWSSILTNPLSPNTVGDIAYGNSTWVYTGDSVGSFDTAYSTDDGLTWTGVANFPRIGGLFRTGTKVAYGNSTWVIGGIGTVTAPSLRYSSDGISWTDCSVSTSLSNVTALYYSSNTSAWYATASNVLAQSSDGIAWTLSSVPFEPTSFGEPPAYLAPSTARLFFPGGLLYDPAGNLYIADQYNNRIRRVTAGSSNVTTYAGTGADTTSNGTLTTAGMARPIQLARDSNGTIYVGSFERNTLQTIIGNNVSLLAGAPFAAGYVDGAPLASRFNGLAGIAVVRDDLYIGEVYNSDVRKLTTLPEVRAGTIRPAGYRIIATSNYPITVNSRIDVSWTSVGGSLPLFKFEPFSNTFAANGCPGSFTPAADSLTYATSSPELLGYLTGTGTSNVAFRGSNGANITYPYTLTLTVRANSNGAVVDDVSTSVTIGPARIIVTPCNTSLVFYRNEPSTNPVFSLVSSAAQDIYSASTLPTGLSFARTASNAFALTGTPTVQTFASNYSILAQDTSGRTYSTQVSMIVNPERLIIDVSGSLSLSGLSSNAPIEPITFTSRFPPYGTDRAVTYSWFPAPPAGLQFRRKDGTAVFGLSQSIAFSTDPSFELTLSGTITSDQIRSYASNNELSTSIVLNGTRTNGGGLLSPAIPKTLTFAFAETILFDSNVPRLYVGQPVSNFYYSAKTYFPLVSNSITSIELIDGFIPDGLDASFTQSTQRFTFTGTPTTASSYAFTLQATNNTLTSISLPIVLTTSNDNITITPIADACYNFIQFRPLSSGKAGFYPSPISYTGRADSGGTVVLTGTNLPTGVSLVATDASAGVYDLSGIPTTSVGSSVATLNALVPLTGATATKTFTYSVSAEVFTFNDLSLAFRENVPITPEVVTVTTLSEQPIIRYSSPSIPAELQIANTGRITGTIITSANGTFDVTAYTPFTTGTKTYSYTVTPDSVLLQPASYQTITAPGCNVSIQINGYSASATTVSNYQISGGSYGLGIGPTSGLLSGTLSSSLPTITTFTLAGSAGDVTGTLVGTMITDNLTTSRAQLIELQEQSNLRVYSSDDLGSNWTLAFSSNALVAGRIGVNGVDTYLIPTSSDLVLRSSTGASYTTSSLGQSAFSPLMTGVAHDSGSSTWWIGGTLSNGTRSVRVFKSLTDGATWDAGTTVSGVQDRSGNASPGAGVYDAYLYGGVDLAYQSGVLLLGGQQIARSSDGGATWTTIPSSLIEVARFSLDQGTVWLAVGSSLYSSTTDNTYTSDATTIVYSTDQGLTWTAAPGGFNMNAYEVAYGDGVWLASGLDWTGSAFVQRIRYSFDGLTWSSLTSVPSHTYGTTLDLRPPGGLGVLGYDQTDWKIIRSPEDGTATLYSHPADVPIDSGWTTATITSEFPGIDVFSRFSSYVVQTIDPGADITTITFPLPNTGPVFTSPAQTTYVLWQYMPIPPITFLAPGATAYFISPLPTGLSWDPATQTITGACVDLGTQAFTVYAQNSGLTALGITLIVEVPRIIKKQSGAGAYTSLLRQYTTVNAAQKARDTRAYPTQVSGIGEFASPYPPAVITPSNCPC